MNKFFYFPADDCYPDQEFSAQAWSAPNLADPQEIMARLSSFHLTGRRLWSVRMVGMDYLARRDSLEGMVYESLALRPDLTEEERRRSSAYVRIPADFSFPRCADLDEPILLRFEGGDTLEIDVSDAPAVRMSMNCIPWAIRAGVNLPNADGDILFSPCIGRRVTDVCLRAVGDDGSLRAVTFTFDNDLQLEIGPHAGFTAVSCLDASGCLVGIPFGEWQRGLHNWQDFVP